MIDSIYPGARKARTVYSTSATARAAIGTLTPGCRVVGVSKGQFSLLDLIGAVLTQTGAADVLVSTWTPGRAEMSLVADMLRRHEITRFRLLVDRSFVTRHPEYVREINGKFGAEAIRQTRTHAKFALIAGGGYRIAIRTSMNFNRNPRFEQFDLDDDPAIYELFDRIADELYDRVPAGFEVDVNALENGFYGHGMVHNGRG